MVGHGASERNLRVNNNNDWHDLVCYSISC